MVRRDSLAVILPLVEEGLSRGSKNVGPDDLQGALADLRAALAAHAGGTRGDRK